MSQQPRNLTKIGEATASRMEKVNSDLFTLTYGSLVTQLLKDFEHVEAVNTQLEKMGYNIGVRLVDEFLARSSISGCQDFRETAEAIAKVGMKMFLGVTCEVTNWSLDGLSCSLIMPDNPLTDFVELPPSLIGIDYSNMICGVIRGALEQLYMKVSCTFVRDVLKGDETNEIRLELKELLKEEFIDDEDDRR